MRVTLMLADAAHAVDGKLYILGGGWSVTGPGPTTMAIAMKIDVPWDQTNRCHEWRLQLVDADGSAVEFDTPAGPQPLHLTGDFEVGRPPGLPEGTPIDLPLTLSIPMIPFPPGQRLVWKLFIDGETSEEWELRFTTRPEAASS